MNEKNCNNTQIYYPKTKRCIKKDTKKAIEYLFSIGDKTIHKLYEEIDGKIVKKCDKNKIRNPQTNRCIKEKKERIIINPKVKINKKNEISVLLDKKIEAIRRVKKALSPYINRVSANIYRRNKYLILMNRELKKYNKGKGCVKIYKQNNDKTFSYRIGNRIILKKRIGTDSVYGIVYLSEFREKEKKVFTFASKIYIYDKTKVIPELEILNKMKDIVRMDLCPHFPLLYGYVICEKSLNNNKDSFIKSREEDKTISQNLQNYPELIKINKNKKIITTFNELANGDIWNFLEVYPTDIKLIANAIIQQYISIMFFNYYIKRVHMDTHPGNFLYHKIKPGGYFHYELFGNDYYLENKGILWVIWDFDLSKTFNEAISIYQYRPYLEDYSRLLRAYLPPKFGGFCKNANIYNNPSLYEFTRWIYTHHNIFFKNDLLEKDINSLKEYIIVLPKILSHLKIDDENVLLTKLPIGAKIINKKPYTITKDELMK